MTTPTEPTTEAGRTLLDIGWRSYEHFRKSILAIEAEARATPAEALDVPTFAVEVRDELTRARSRFGPIASLHEGYAVILEELDEFWEDVRSNDPDRLIRAYRELVQVAAMAQRTAEDAIARLRSPEGDRCRCPSRGAGRGAAGTTTPRGPAPTGWLGAAH